MKTKISTKMIITLNDCPLPVPLSKISYLCDTNLKISYYEFTEIF